MTTSRIAVSFQTTRHDSINAGAVPRAAARASGDRTLLLDHARGPEQSDPVATIWRA